MQNANRMVKKSGLYMIGNLSSKFVNFILIPVYAFTLSAKDLGIYDFYQTIVNFIEPFAFLAIWEAILRFLLAEEEQKEIVIGSTLRFIFIALVIVILTGIGGLFIVKNPLLWTCGVCMLISLTLSHVWQYFARGLHLNTVYVSASIISALINFFLNITLIYIFRFNAYAIFLAFIISNIVTVFWIEYKIKVFGYFKSNYYSKKLLKKMLIFSSPLVLNLASAWMILGFGRVIINTNLGVEATGLYAFANKFGIVVISLGQVVSMALIEESIISKKEGNLGAFFTRTINSLFEIFLGIIIIASPAISIFYYLISNTEYYASINVFPWLLMYSVCTIMSTNIGAIFQAVDKTKFQYRTTLLGGIGVVIISLLTINFLGVTGVVIAQLCGAIIMLMTRYYLARKYVEIKLHILTILAMICWYIISSIISVSCGLYIAIVIFTFNLIVMGLIYRKYIQALWNKFSGRLVWGS
ncbi:lipopolysaccharide biosynthesis protein [Priestia aryabhattai]